MKSTTKNRATSYCSTTRDTELRETVPIAMATHLCVTFARNV